MPKNTKKGKFNWDKIQKFRNFERAYYGLKAISAKRDAADDGRMFYLVECHITKAPWDKKLIGQTVKLRFNIGTKTDPKAAEDETWTTGGSGFAAARLKELFDKCGVLEDAHPDELIGKLKGKSFVDFMDTQTYIDAGGTSRKMQSHEFFSTEERKPGKVDSEESDESSKPSKKDKSAKKSKKAAEDDDEDDDEDESEDDEESDDDEDEEGEEDDEESDDEEESDDDDDDDEEEEDDEEDEPAPKKKKKKGKK